MPMLEVTRARATISRRKERPSPNRRQLPHRCGRSRTAPATCLGILILMVMEANPAPPQVGFFSRVSARPHVKPTGAVMVCRPDRGGHRGGLIISRNSGGDPPSWGCPRWMRRASASTPRPRPAGGHFFGTTQRWSATRQPSTNRCSRTDTITTTSGIGASADAAIRGNRIWKQLLEEYGAPSIDPGVGEAARLCLASEARDHGRPPSPTHDGRLLGMGANTSWSALTWAGGRWRSRPNALSRTPP